MTPQFFMEILKQGGLAAVLLFWIMRHLDKTEANRQKNEDRNYVEKEKLIKELSEMTKTMIRIEMNMESQARATEDISQRIDLNDR